MSLAAKGEVMTEIIKTAIESKKCLYFQYHGFERIVEPHTYGKTTAGNDAIRAYQIRGESESGGLPEWRLFRKDEIHGLRLLDEAAQTPRRDYKRGDKGMRVIYCQV
jgi:predicted DNA-binding transcriptional regulator YafY